MTRNEPGWKFPLIVLTALAPLATSLAIGQPRDDAPESYRGVDRMTVTGSRLRDFFADGVLPLTTIDRDELRDSGQQRLGDFLQQLAYTAGSPLNTQTSQRGAGGELSRGAETVELRGLGSERTLVLVNGRRFVPGGNGASGVVDLGMLPLAMIERIEVFKSGASVEYGADALAGVINVITRQPFDGVEVSAQGRTATRGDGENALLEWVAGRQFRKGGWVAGISWTDQQPVSKGARGFSSTRLTLTGPDNEIAFDGSSAPPGGQYRTSFGRFTLIEGRDGDSPADFRPFVNSGPDTDRFNFNPFEDLLQASERLSVFGQGEWFAADDVRLYAEALAHWRDSSQRLAPLPFFTTRLSDVTVASTNVFNPFGEDLTDVRRRLVEAGQRRFTQDNEAWRFALGADGRLGKSFWDVSVAHGRNETTQVQSGDLLADRVRRALGPSFIDANGRYRCGTPDAPIDGCVPLNLFGGPGSITPEMLDYVGAALTDTGFNEQTVLNANLAGDGPSIPAGTVAWAAGVEWRQERAGDRPDPQTRAGNTTGNARARTQGSFEAVEAYVEAGVPLLTDAGGEVALSLDLGARAVDFSNSGADQVFEIGLGWQPIRTLGLRLAWTQAFRAPNVRELFGGASQANPIVLDPCADFAGLSPESIQRCVEQGVPADGSFSQSGEETPEISGGNPDLVPEQAEMFTAGVTWRPAAVDNLQISADFYDIDIRDGIGTLGAQTTLAQCLATGAARFCEAIRRTGDGAIDFVEARLRNIARESMRGIDAALDWRHRLGAVTLDHTLGLAWIAERQLIAFPGSAPLFGAGGFDPDNFGAIPEWQGRYGLDADIGDWTLGYRAQFIGRVVERGGEVFPGTSNPAGPVLYHDLFARFRPAGSRWSTRSLPSRPGRPIRPAGTTAATTPSCAKRDSGLAYANGP
jgi:outer membrane receptor protein involved in Fe transport